LYSCSHFDFLKVSACRCNPDGSTTSCSGQGHVYFGTKRYFLRSNAVAHRLTKETTTFSSGMGTEKRVYVSGKKTTAYFRANSSTVSVIDTYRLAVLGIRTIIHRYIVRQLRQSVEFSPYSCFSSQARDPRLLDEPCKPEHICNTATCQGSGGAISLRRYDNQTVKGLTKNSGIP